MANNIEITHDTNRLRNDMSRINDAVIKVENEYRKMNSEILQLTSMWSGPAKDAFALQYRFDQMILMRTIHCLKKYSADLETICKRYEKADVDVADEIGKLR